MGTNMDVKIGHGAELYNEVQRLVFEFLGQDATVQRSQIPHLIADIVRLAERHTAAVASAAAHDKAEAA